MFSSKCANAECSTPFDYRRGRFFRFQREPQDGSGASPSGVEHFWLCDRCASTYTIVYLHGHGVLAELESFRVRPERAAPGNGLDSGKASGGERFNHCPGGEGGAATKMLVEVKG